MAADLAGSCSSLRLARMAASRSASCPSAVLPALPPRCPCALPRRSSALSSWEPSPTGAKPPGCGGPGVGLACMEEAELLISMPAPDRLRRTGLPPRRSDPTEGGRSIMPESSPPPRLPPCAEVVGDPLRDRLLSREVRLPLPGRPELCPEAGRFGDDSGARKVTARGSGGGGSVGVTAGSGLENASASRASRSRMLAGRAGGAAPGGVTGRGAAPSTAGSTSSSSMDIQSSAILFVAVSSHGNHEAALHAARHLVVH